MGSAVHAFSLVFSPVYHNRDWKTLHRRALVGNNPVIPPTTPAMGVSPPFPSGTPRMSRHGRQQGLLLHGQTLRRLIRVWRQYGSDKKASECMASAHRLQSARIELWHLA